MLATAPSIQLDQHDGYDDKTDLGKKMNRFEQFEERQIEESWEMNMHFNPLD